MPKKSDSVVKGDAGSTGGLGTSRARPAMLFVLILAAIGVLWLGSAVLPRLAASTWGESTSLGAIFLIGLTAGGLSCLAVQGGLLATAAAGRPALAATPQAGERLAPTLLFLGAKLVAHAVLGGLLGLFGTLLVLGPAARGWFQIAIALFMILMALHLLDLHPRLRYLVFQPPRQVQRLLRQTARRGDAVAPLALGALTVLVPCGVTQAMMVLALGAGSALKGALILVAFVLGTTPLFLSLGLLTTQVSRLWQGTLSRLTALVIIGMALYTMLGGVRLLGVPVTLAALPTLGPTMIAPPSVEVNPAPAEPPSVLPGSLITTLEEANTDTAVEVGGVQEATLTVHDFGYSPERLRVRVGLPTRLTLVTEDSYSCANAFTIPALNISRFLPATGRETIEFTPTEVGQIAFTCSMGMYGGVIEVVQ